MIKIVFNDIIKERKDYNGIINNFSMLDIGAGNGNLFKYLKNYYENQKMNIPKIQIQKNLPLKNLKY